MFGIEINDFILLFVIGYIGKLKDGNRFQSTSITYTEYP